MAVTSSKRLRPGDEDNVHRKDFFTPVGVQWGLKDAECEWLNGNIAFDNVALGNPWLVGQPSPGPCGRSGSACQSVCLPHQALKAEMRSAIWMRGGKTVLAALRNAFAGPQRISPGYLQKRLCQWLWNSLQHLLNDQHNPQKYQIQFSRRKEGPKMEELLLSQIDGARAATQLLRLRTSWFKWHPAAAPAARN